ncbi:hypothetical protein JXR93_02435 [bacterium]|nr:hypothetical protein [bacterium]
MMIFYLFASIFFYSNNSVKTLEFYQKDLIKSVERIDFTIKKSGKVVDIDKLSKNSDCYILDRDKNEILFVNQEILSNYDSCKLEKNRFINCKKDNSTKIESLFSFYQKSFEIDIKNIDKELIDAIYSRCVEKVEELLKNGANPNALNSFKEYPAMNLQHQSIVFVDINKKSIKISKDREKDKKILSLLLFYGADLNLKDQYGKTFIDREIEFGNLNNFIDILIKYRDKIDCILKKMIDTFNYEKFIELVELGIDINRCNPFKASLYISCSEYDHRFFNYFIENRAMELDIIHRDDYPLIFYANVGCFEPETIGNLRKIIDLESDINQIEFNFLDRKEPITILDRTISSLKYLHSKNEKCFDNSIDKPSNCHIILEKYKYNEDFYYYLLSKSAKRACELLEIECNKL